MTDHDTDRFAERLHAEAGVWAFVNRLSRLVVDPERFTDPALERMEAAGMGAVYTATSDRRPLREPAPGEREALLERWFHPYAAALADAVTELVDGHGRCLVVDLHSYPAAPLAYELDPHAPRPEVCVGTDPFHTPEALARRVEAVAADHGLETARDTPFAGTYVPLRHHGRDRRVTSVMIELRRDTYRPDPAPVEAFLLDLAAALAADA